MATRETRLSEFTTIGVPPANEPMELLCEDGSGTYTLPFVCHWSSGLWFNTAKGILVEGKVVGWRTRM